MVAAKDSAKNRCRVDNRGQAIMQLKMTRAAVTVIGETHTSAGMRLTIFPCGTPLEGLGGALQLVAPLAQGILAVVDPSLHMRREYLKRR